MALYLISFDDGAMTFPEADLPAVAAASHAVVDEARDAGVWVFGAGLHPHSGDRGGHGREGHRRPGEQGVHRRVLRR